MFTILAEALIFGKLRKFQYQEALFQMMIAQFFLQMNIVMTKQT